MKLSEVFGTAVDDLSEDAKALRQNKWCRFRNNACTKVRKDDPLGVCSLGMGSDVTIVCPSRFNESGRVFKDAATLAFGKGSQVVVLPEYKLLTVSSEVEAKDKKIGKVDFMLGKLINGCIVDFAALEIQAVYSSGGGVGDAFQHYLATSFAGQEGDLGVDFRSSAQKRLVPQLRLKVPIFRRWGKKFFVAIDSTFFSALPNFGSTSSGNSEVTWLAYPVEKTLSGPLALGDPSIYFTEWSKVESALEEGSPPDGPEEVISELQPRISGNKIAKYRVVET